MPRLLRAASLAFVVPLVLIAGCNSSTQQGDAKPNNRGASASNDPIKIGGVVTKTSSASYAKPDVDLGAKARFMMANDEGGVNGREIDYIGSEDDGQDPARTTSVVRKLVQQDKVFAVVPVGTSTITAVADFLNQSEVPYIGWGSSSGLCGKEYGMGYNGCLVPGSGKGNTAWPTALAQALGGAQGKTVAIIGQDLDASKLGTRMYQQLFQTTGFTVSYAKNTVPGTTIPTDWSAWVNDLMTAGNGKAPDAVVSIMQTPTNIGLFTALKRAGYKGALSDGTAYDASLLKQDASREALQGVYSFVQHQPFEVDLPEMTKFKEYISKAKGSTVTEFNQWMMAGWSSADLFVSVAKKAGDNLTVESYQAAAANYQDSYALVGNRRFPEGRTESFGCGSLVQVEDTAFNVVSPFTCPPTAQLQK